jgi:hypothetical protein
MGPDGPDRAVPLFADDDLGFANHAAIDTQNFTSPNPIIQSSWPDRQAANWVLSKENILAAGSA